MGKAWEQGLALCLWKVTFLQKGQTALMYAIRGNHVKVFEKLIMSGSNANMKDKVRLMYCLPLYTHCITKLLIGFY